MPKSPRAITETDLYRPVHDYLVSQGYTVRSEVHHCDIAAVKDDRLIVVELKRGMSLALLAQAVQRQKITESVYIAIPRPANKRKWQAQTQDVQHLLRRLEIGLLLVSLSKRAPAVEVILHPLPFERRKRSARKRAVLEEIERRTGDYNQGGSCRRKLVTAYRENAIHIACCLSACGPLTPRKLRALGTGDKTLAILYRNVYGWFDHADRGLYSLTTAGATELEQFPELAAHYREKLAGQVQASE